MRWRRALVVGGLVASLVVVLASIRLFVDPEADPPAQADAIVVLSGDRGERMAEALRLADKGVAPVLVHAGTPDSAFVKRLCAGRSPYQAVCVLPDPDSTREEARAVARLARRRGWDRLAVVTSTYHVTRAGLVFGRCHDGVVRMVRAEPDISLARWAFQVVHEWGGTLEAVLLRPGC